jgi:hypothetical protein
MGFSSDPKRVLSTDFDESKRDKLRKLVISNNICFYRCFATPDGQRVLRILDEMTSGHIIDTNVHTSIANAAKRDLVDLIRMASKLGLEELSKNE